MNKYAFCAIGVVVLAAYSGRSLAAVVSYTSSYTFSADAYGPHPPEGDADAFGIAEVRSVGPAQFNPALGTLTGVSYTLDDDYEIAYSMSWRGFPVLPDDVPGYTATMWSAYIVPNRPIVTFNTFDYETHVTALAYDELDIHGDDSTDGDELGPVGGTLEGSFTGTYTYSSSTESLGAFIGTGNIDSKRYIDGYAGNWGIYLYNQVWGTFGGEYTGEATVTYTYDPAPSLVVAVPEPSLLMLSLLALPTLLRRR